MDCKGIMQWNITIAGAAKNKRQLIKIFGLMDLGDGLAIQKEMRDEWN